jgi:hypothetical protein
MAPLGIYDYDRDCWFLDDDPPKKNSATVRIKRFFQTCIESVDDTCMSYCCSSSPVDDGTVGALSPTNSIQRLEPLNVNISAQDLEEFASKGGFYDGTFCVDEDDYNVDNIRFDEDSHYGMTDIRFDEDQPPPACPPIKRMAFPPRNGDVTWWSLASKHYFPKVVATRTRTGSLPWR